MNKQNQIKTIHKILFIKEDIDNVEITNITIDDLKKYISNTLIRFCGMNIEDNLKSKIVETLGGLHALCDKLSHNEIRTAVLGLMNDVDREE